jgi:hypothetical protein
MNLYVPDSPQNKLTVTLPAILPVTYLPPINLMAAMFSSEDIKWDIHEHYHKQFFYNRCVIYGPNGAQKLTIPVHKKYEKTPLKDILIGYEIDWQRIHWCSLEAAYRRSPYFEYYEDALEPLFLDYTPKYLVEWNIRILEAVGKLMETEIKRTFTAEYRQTHNGATDYRNLAIPKEAAKAKEIKYMQVFEEKHGFINNLSIIDLLFCEGPHAKELLLS